VLVFVPSAVSLSVSAPLVTLELGLIKQFPGCDISSRHDGVGMAAVGQGEGQEDVV